MTFAVIATIIALAAGVAGRRRGRHVDHAIARLMLAREATP